MKENKLFWKFLYSPHAQKVQSVVSIWGKIMLNFVIHNFIFLSCSISHHRRRQQLRQAALDFLSRVLQRLN